MQYYLPLALLLNALIFASAGAQTSEAPTYYQDCAVLDFGEQDRSIYDDRSGENTSVRRLLIWRAKPKRRMHERSGAIERTKRS